MTHSVRQKALVAAACLVCLAGSPATGVAQDLVRSFQQPWQSYVFVSSRMPRASLVSLAREAMRTQSTLVLRGFGEGKFSLAELQAFIDSINRECCEQRPGAWVVDPKLFDQYQIQTAPTFVLSGNPNRPDAYAVVQGDMSIASALKFFAQQSKLPAVREQAGRLYYRAFGGSN